MNKVEFRPSNLDQNAKLLAFQQRNHSRQYNKSKSSKKNHINKNLLVPCEPLGDKLSKASANQRKQNNRRQKTQQSMIQTEISLDNQKCINHPDKKGEYYLQSQPNKRFCLKCNLTLNSGNNSRFVTKEKLHKKMILDNFRQQLGNLKEQIQNSRWVLQNSIQNSEQLFSDHSAYINESFTLIKEQLEEKRREMLNNLIMAQQSLKRQFEENCKKLKKMSKSIERYEFDIKKFYEEIIEELPKAQFDHIMEEYEEKINNNFKNKLKNILCQDGICVYIPNLELKNIIDKSNVEYYQPVSQRCDQYEPNLSFVQKQNFSGDQKRVASNSLDSKMNDLVSNVCLQKRPGEPKLMERRKQPDFSIFERKTANFLSPTRDSKNRLMQDKQNINFQNFSHDYFNPKNDQAGRFTFKS